MSDNFVSVTGNVTRDPELRYSPSAKAFANFGVAINNRRRAADGGYEDGDPYFFDITCFGSLAENLAESVSKGDRVTVNGRLEYRTWETDTGDKRSKVQIIADEVAPSLRWATASTTKTAGRGASKGSEDRYLPPDDDEEPF